MGQLDGRVAIVTGAGAGLGREHALLMAAEGAASWSTTCAEHSRWQTKSSLPAARPSR